MKKRIPNHPIPTNRNITAEHVKAVVAALPPGEWVPTKKFNCLMIQAARISGYRIDTKLEMRNGSRKKMTGYYKLVS